MPHVFFGLTIAGILALCAFGMLPPDQFVDVAKWVTILYASSSTMVAVVRHIWPRPPRDEVPAFTTDAIPWPSPQEGVEALGPFGSLEGDVFSDQLGDKLPANYTSMVRHYDAPPVTTEGADGATVTVPTETAPPLDFDGVFGPKPPIPHDFNRRAASVAPVSVPAPNVVVLGDPPHADIDSKSPTG